MPGQKLSIMWDPLHFDPSPFKAFKHKYTPLNSHWFCLIWCIFEYSCFMFVHPKIANCVGSPAHTACIKGYCEVKKCIKNAIKSINFISIFCALKVWVNSSFSGDCKWHHKKSLNWLIRSQGVKYANKISTFDSIFYTIFYFIVSFYAGCDIDLRSFKALKCKYTPPDPYGFHLIWRVFEHLCLILIHPEITNCAGSPLSQP